MKSKLKPLPYLSRPELENELTNYLSARLSPKQNMSKALVLSGLPGVGKKTIIDYILKTRQELKAYQLIDPVGIKEAVPDSKKMDYLLITLKNVLQVLGKFTPKSIDILLTILAGIPDIFEKKKKEFSIENPQELLKDFWFTSINQPILLIAKIPDLSDPEMTACLAHFIEESYHREHPISMIILNDTNFEDENIGIKNIHRFLTDENHLNELEVSPISRESFCAHFEAFDFSERWIETLYQFSEGLPFQLAIIWEHLQIEKMLIPLSNNNWGCQDDPLVLFKPESIREMIHRLYTPPRVPENSEFREFLPWACLWAAAMGEKFLPQAVAEIALPENRRGDESYYENWEDTWYQFLEYEDENHPAIISINTDETTPDLIESDTRSHYLYQFREPVLHAFLQLAAKNLCSPVHRNTDFYAGLDRLAHWFNAGFKTNWLCGIPFLKSIYYTMWNNFRAQNLAKIQYQHQMLAELALKIEHEHQKMRRKKSANHLFILLLWYAEILKETCQYKPAIRILEEAGDLIKNNMVQIGSNAQVDYWLQIGSVYREDGQYIVARDFHSKALELARKIHQERHAQVARCLNNLGLAWHALGEHRQAIAYYEQALAIDRAVFGEQHPNVAIRLNNLGLAWKALGEHKKAIAYYEQALAIWKEVFGEQHPQVATGLNNLGSAWHDLGEHQKAIAYYEQALAIDRAVFGEQHPDVAIDLNNLGSVYFNLGEKVKARGYFQKAHAINLKFFGPNHPDSRRTASWLELCD